MLLISARQLELSRALLTSEVEDEEHSEKSTSTLGKLADSHHCVKGMEGWMRIDESSLCFLVAVLRISIPPLITVPDNPYSLRPFFLLTPPFLPVMKALCSHTKKRLLENSLFPLLYANANRHLRLHHLLLLARMGPPHLPRSLAALRQLAVLPRRSTTTTRGRTSSGLETARDS